MSRKRSLAWLLYVAALTALGVAIYHFEQPVPRWIVGFDGPAFATMALSTDGARLMFVPEMNGGGRAKRLEGAAQLQIHREPEAFVMDEDEPAPERLTLLHVWGTATGREISRHPNAGCDAGILNRMFSSDNRFFAAEFVKENERRLLLVDTQSSREWLLPFPPMEVDPQIAFSDSGKELIVTFAREGNPPRRQQCLIYGSSDGNLLLERVGDDLSYVGDADGRVLLQNRRGQEREIEIWDARRRKREGKLSGFPAWSRLHVRDDFLLAQEVDRDSNLTGQWSIWNIKTQRRLAHFAGLPHHHDFIVGPRGKDWLALFGEKKGQRLVELRHFPTGRAIDSIVTPVSQNSSLAAPNGSSLVTYHELVPVARAKQARGGMSVIDSSTVQELWREEDVRYLKILFSSDSRHIVTAPEDAGAVRIHDSATGAIRRIISLPDQWGPQIHLTTADQLLITQSQHQWAESDAPWRKLLRWIGVDPARFEPKSNDVVIVFDVAAGRERFRLCGWSVIQEVLSDDGAFLITMHEQPEGRFLCCWNTDAWKPLRWPLGVPLGLGLGLIGVVKVGRRWRRVPSAQPQQSASPTS